MSARDQHPLRRPRRPRRAPAATPAAIAAEAAALLADARRDPPAACPPRRWSRPSPSAGDAQLGTTLDRIAELRRPARGRAALPRRARPAAAVAAPARGRARRARLARHRGPHATLAPDEAVGVGLARWGIAEDRLARHPFRPGYADPAGLPAAAPHRRAARRASILAHLEDYAAVAAETGGAAQRRPDHRPERHDRHRGQLRARGSRPRVSACGSSLRTCPEVTIAVGCPESCGTDAHEPASEGGALYAFDYNPPAAGPVNDDTFRINNLRPRFPHAARHWPCNQTSCFRPQPRRSSRDRP